jgi:hypothetical protein
MTDSRARTDPVPLCDENVEPVTKTIYLTFVATQRPVTLGRYSFVERDMGGSHMRLSLGLVLLMYASWAALLCYLRRVVGVLYVRFMRMFPGSCTLEIEIGW